jgi:drug/metabolite transporter (DMT)-like permease
MGKSNILLVSSFYALLSITFWGLSFVSTKALLDALDPYTIISMRFGIASIFLLFLVLLLKQRIWIQTRDIPFVFILAVLGVFIHQLIQVSALLFINASSAGWIISFSPIFTVILSVFFLSERFKFNTLIGMTVAVAGVFLVTTQDKGTGNFSPNLGYLLMISSTLNWAVYSILLKRFRLPYSSLVVTFWTSLIGTFLTFPLFYRSRGWEHVPLLSMQDWTHLLFLGIFVSAIAYWYWGKALEVLEATQVSVLMYLQPLVTVTAAVFLLKEHIVLTTIVGGFLIIAGVSTVNKQLYHIVMVGLLAILGKK